MLTHFLLCCLVLTRLPRLPQQHGQEPVHSFFIEGASQVTSLIPFVELKKYWDEDNFKKKMWGSFGVFFFFVSGADSFLGIYLISVECFRTLPSHSWEGVLGHIVIQWCSWALPGTGGVCLCTRGPQSAVLHPLYISCSLQSKPFIS